MKATARHQRGFTAVLAVLFIVILAALGAFMATTSGVQHMSTALSWHGMQAWFAARSAMDWAARQATSSQTSHDAICSSPATTTAFGVVLSGQTYNVNVSCDDQGGFTEGGIPYEVDRITVTAMRGTAGTLAHAARTVTATVSSGGPLPP